MKTMKKTMALVLTLVMALVLAVPAWAATTGTITITSPSDAQDTDEFTYKIYKVFDAVASDDGISYKVMSGKTGVPDVSAQMTSGYDAATTPHFILDSVGNVHYGTETTESGKTVITDVTSGDLSEAAIKAVAAYIEGDDPIDTVEITGGAEEGTAAGLANGYYYVTTTTGTVVAITSTKPDAEITDKNPLPSLDKDIASVTETDGSTGHVAGADNESGENATASIGDTVNYSVNITAQKGAENYIYHDKLSAGLTLVTTTEPVVKVGSTALTKDTDYTLTHFANETDNSKDDITITFTKDYLDTITAETVINITYSAVVNDNAVIAGDGNKNTGTLDYGHDPDDSTKPGNTTPPDEPVVYVYEFQLVKDNSSKKILDGAEFELYAADKTTRIVVAADGDNYKVAQDQTGTSVMIVAGKPVIKGLGNGTYYLKETKAPEGYNVLKDMIEVTIADANNDATIDGTTYTSGGVEVVNQAGQELPGTGGIGTKIFYTMGAVLVVGAGVVLVSRKRAGE